MHHQLLLLYYMYYSVSHVFVICDRGRVPAYREGMRFLWEHECGIKDLKMHHQSWIWQQFYILCLHVKETIVPLGILWRKHLQ